jgi:peroxiredoxin
MSERLNNGQTFPKLQLPAVGGSTLHLPEDLFGKYSVILIYRGHWCPFCNEQIAAFVEAFAALNEKGIMVAAFSADNEEVTREFVEKHRIPFPVGHSADVGEVVQSTGAYDATFPTRGHFLESTGFVLAPDGTVINAVYSSRAIGRLVPGDVVRLVTFMEGLRAQAAVKYGS